MSQPFFYDTGSHLTDKAELVQAASSRATIADDVIRLDYIPGRGPSLCGLPSQSRIASFSGDECWAFVTDQTAIREHLVYGHLIITPLRAT
jgi:hypothetical protein